MKTVSIDKHLGTAVVEMTVDEAKTLGAGLFEMTLNPNYKRLKFEAYQKHQALMIDLAAVLTKLGAFPPTNKV